MQEIGPELEKLASNAVKYGAYRAQIIPAIKVVVDPRVRMKCSIPLCENFGRNRMCPPNIMSVEEFSRALAAYKWAIVVQFHIGCNEEEIKHRYQDKDLAGLMKDRDYADSLTKGMREMLHALAQLERDALYMGFYLAAALSGGCCRLCDECVGPGQDKQCRHPFQARPSIEAMGVDAVATARNAGLTVEFPAKEHPTWTALLLVD
jgi:predicted metal-binding protein